MNEKLKEYREEITAKLVEAIKAGTAPWQMPWNGRSAPQNGISGRMYRGINQIILMAKGAKIDGGEDPRWVTFKQASEKGWKVKKGSKGTHVVLWKPYGTKDEETGEIEITGVMQKFFTVFHATQIDGIGKYEPAELNEIEAYDKAEEIIRNSGAKIYYGGGSAYYSPTKDYIQLPIKGDFKSTEGYYSTLLHELTHWTGHASRLNRGFGNEAYEELVAEIGSMFVSSSAGIPQTEGEFQNHASYVDSWLTAIKHDPNALFKAAADANRAADYLLKEEKKE